MLHYFAIDTCLPHTGCSWLRRRLRLSSLGCTRREQLRVPGSSYQLGKRRILSDRSRPGTYQLGKQCTRSRCRSQRLSPLRKGKDVLSQSDALSPLRKADNRLETLRRCRFCRFLLDTIMQRWRRVYSRSQLGKGGTWCYSRQTGTCQRDTTYTLPALTGYCKFQVSKAVAAESRRGTTLQGGRPCSPSSD